MINYYLRPGGAYVKIDTEAQIVSLVLNNATQKTISIISNNTDYYNNTVAASANWPVSSESVFENEKNTVLQEINLIM